MLARSDCPTWAVVVLSGEGRCAECLQGQVQQVTGRAMQVSSRFTRCLLTTGKVTAHGGSIMYAPLKLHRAPAILRLQRSCLRVGLASCPFE